MEDLSVDIVESISGGAPLTEGFLNLRVEFVCFYFSTEVGRPVIDFWLETMGLFFIWIYISAIYLSFSSIIAL